RIPMLFVALGYEDGMKITVDGVPVGFGKLPNEAYIRENSPKSRFQDPETQSDLQEVRISFREGERRIYDLSDLHFFEFDLAAGAHQIQVVYEARQWRDRSDYVADAYFLYTLSPAKYWKSFGQLDVTLDARGLPFPVVTNLGAPTSGDLKGEAKWHFDKLPEVETIQVSWKPEVSATAEFMISIGEGGFFWISWVVFALIHLAAIWWWRRKHIGKWFSWTWLIGSILIPALICFVYVQSETWIDAAIGPAASGFGSYSFLIIIFYPVFLVGHGAVMLFADYLIRRYRRKRA
ncbi:MAG TPA: hypothetical protein VHS96_05250, partial [Bacteroidia bacterium]|nr:hypothetical protein [Bacteroidia bacterium]